MSPWTCSLVTSAGLKTSVGTMSGPPSTARSLRASNERGRSPARVAQTAPSLWRQDSIVSLCGDEISIVSLCGDEISSCLLWRRDSILSILQVEKLAATRKTLLPQASRRIKTMAGDFVMDSALVAWSGPSRFHMGNPSLKLRTVGADHPLGQLELLGHPETAVG